MRHTVAVTDWDEPFPFKEAADCFAEWGVLYVVVGDLGNDSIHWVFSDMFVDERAAAAMARRARSSTEPTPER